MGLFKYTVANKEGKKLSGTVESSDIEIAKKELNNLGFSIFSIEEIKKSDLAIKEGHQMFEFDAIDKDKRSVKGSIPAQDTNKAKTRLETEYQLNVIAVWPATATEEEKAKIISEGQNIIQNIFDKPIELIQDEKHKEEEKFLKDKINKILKEVDELRAKFEKDFDADIKTLIKKKIDKLLRIKNSNNLEYIHATAKDLLKFIQKQEKSLKEKGLHEERFELKVETGNLLDKLKSAQKTKSLGEDITEKIDKWKKSSSKSPSKTVSKVNSYLSGVLNWIYNKFDTPEEIKQIKSEISEFKRERMEYIQLYFKEPTKEYKQKVVSNIKRLNKSIKEGKIKIKEVKANLKNLSKKPVDNKETSNSILTELNALTGWMLAIYIIYYIIAIYINTKDFGLTQIPKGFDVYNSFLMKYLISITFIIHCATAVKLNYFKTSKIANFIIPAVTILILIITIFNF